MTISNWIHRYGGFVAVLVVFAGVLVVAPSKSPEQVSTYGGTGAGAQRTPSGEVTDDAALTGDTTVDANGSPVATSGAGGATQPVASAVAGKLDCARQAFLGDDFPCKPPFVGKNSGASAKGVAGDSVTLLWYRDKRNEQVQALLDAAGNSVSPEDQERSFQKMVTWLNANFQTYGRSVKLVVVDGKADNKDIPAQRADAQEVDQKHKPFVVLSGARADFIDELARRQVISFGAPQLTSKFYVDRAPFVFGVLPDADTTNKHIAEYIGKRLGASSKAKWGGDASVPIVNGQTRAYGIVFPNLPEYAAAADDLAARMTGVGAKPVAKIGYAADINQAATTAQNVVAQLVAANVTTVLCVCDPIAPVFFTPSATKQGYFPEWLQTGYLLQDVAQLARLYDKEQWSHNFGVSSLPVFQALEKTTAYQIQKQVAPNEIPATGTGWSTFVTAFAAIERAGPRLDPATFRDGLFTFKVRAVTKYDVAYGFSPTDFGGIDDAREVWWDNNAPDETDGKNGTYQSVNGGFRYELGRWPTSPPRVFEPQCTAPGSCGGRTFG